MSERVLTVAEDLVVVVKPGYVKIMHPNEMGVDWEVYVGIEEIPNLCEVLLRVYQTDGGRDSSLRSE